MIATLIVTAALICQADLNNDGVVNGLDVGPFSESFGQGCPTTGTLNLSWTNPANDTSCTPTSIISNTVYWFPGNTQGVNIPASSAYQVVGLHPGVDYAVWVTATNAAGESDASLVVVQTAH